jgi:PqqD family protein of HPr-rel-A system
MSSSISELAISESGFVFDPRTGATFSVNSTGLSLLGALRRRSTVPEIVELFRKSFEATPPDVRDHVEDFLRTLHHLGIAAGDE